MSVSRTGGVDMIRGMDPRMWPLWMRCQLAGLLYSGCMYAFVATGPRTVMSAVVYLAVGVAFGAALFLVVRRLEHRMFGDLTRAGRATAIEAIRRGRPAAEPEVQEAATRLARRWAAPGRQPRYQAIIFGLFVLLSVYVAVTVTPWGWLLVAFWLVAGPLAVRSESRQRRAALRFLQAAPTA